MEHPKDAFAKIVQGEEYHALQKSFASQTGSTSVMLSPDLVPMTFFSRPPASRLHQPTALSREQSCCLGDDSVFRAATRVGEIRYICLECKTEVLIQPVMVRGVLAGFGCLLLPGAENPLLLDYEGIGAFFAAWVRFVERKIQLIMVRNQDRREAEAKAARTQGRLERLELALWGSGLALWDWNMETDEVYRSSDWTRMQGYDPGEVEHSLSAWRNMIHPEDREITVKYLESFRKGLVDSYESDFRLLRKDGSHHWVRERGKVVERNGSGKPTRSVGTMRDIDHRKVLAKALEENRRQLETLLSNLPGMAYRCRFDRGWTLEFASQGCKELTGFDPEQVVNNPEHSFARMIYGEDLAEVREKVQAALEVKKPFSLTYRLVTADGSIKWVSEHGVGYWNENGDIVALEGFISDISSLKESERDKLDQAKLEAAMQTAGAACHELNQPLQSLMLRLELCLLKADRDDPLSKELNRMLGFAETMAGITRRLARVTMFRTSSYLGETRILDLSENE